MLGSRRVQINVSPTSPLHRTSLLSFDNRSPVDAIEMQLNSIKIQMIMNANRRL